MLMNLIYDFGLCTHELSWLAASIHSDLASFSFLSGLNLEQLIAQTPAPLFYG